MTNRTTLHWSFNHDNHVQTPFFAGQLVSTLRGLPSAKGEAAAHYDILPNYWRGFKQAYEISTVESDLRIGEITISPYQMSNRDWHYNIRSLNTTSGENVHLVFNCTDDPLRPMVDDWRVIVKNNAGDGYRNFEGLGQRIIQTDEAQITLTVNNVPLKVGCVDQTEPLICNWALFDVIPLVGDWLKQENDVISITLLEDLEKIRTDTQLGYLEDWALIIDEDDGKTLHLQGYYLYGQGLVPSYWWLDEHNRVVIVSSTFQTWVLRGYHD